MGGMDNSMWLTEEQKRRRLWAIILLVFVVGIIMLATIPDWGSEDVSEEINITQVAEQNADMKEEIEDIKESLEKSVKQTKEYEEKIRAMEQEKALADKESLNKRISELESIVSRMNGTIINLTEENKNKKAIIENLEDEVDSYKDKLKIADEQIKRLNQTNGTG